MNNREKQTLLGKMHRTKTNKTENLTDGQHGLPSWFYLWDSCCSFFSFFSILSCISRFVCCLCLCIIVCWLPLRLSLILLFINDVSTETLINGWMISSQGKNWPVADQQHNAWNKAVYFIFTITLYIFFEIISSNHSNSFSNLNIEIKPTHIQNSKNKIIFY